MLKKEYFFKSQESLATVIDNDEEEDEDEPEVETPEPEVENPEPEVETPDENSVKPEDNPNATTANAPEQKQDDVSTASNNVDTIQTASKKTTTV